MRIPIVRFGDSTTTGGKVHAFNTNMRDQGNAIALRGEPATCRNCKGTWPIVGTGHRMRNDDRPVVLQGDNVLCPCGKNRVIAGPDAKCFYHRTPDEMGTRPTLAPARSVATYDQFFRVLNPHNGQPLRDVPYRIVTEYGEEIEGRTDA
ncbi:PAAR domain-containing protein [Paraburkholderia sp. J41]|uniref:PAAR domain-containing protein n=1 Tax=Paraburkholderia sp. J41 TaxID=2805433 RepID=UPI002AC362D3|nr:PAAR domain-containing protein [Paraburkholderia sp. J41]